MYERDKINIMINEYNYIKDIGDVDTIIIHKIFYVDILTTVETFEFTKEEFLNLRLLKGKTKDHYRVKLNKIDTEKRDSIKWDLFCRELNLEVS